MKAANAFYNKAQMISQVKGNQLCKVNNKILSLENSFRIIMASSKR